MSRVDEIRERITATETMPDTRQRTSMLDQLGVMLRQAVREEQLGE